MKRSSFGTKKTTLCWSSHSGHLLEQLNTQRNFETFCDVVVHVGDNSSFRAHRCILAASSAKLYTLMFSTSNECIMNVHLDGISVSGFKIMLEFIYTGMLNFDTDSITDVITTATYLEMPTVIRLCEEFANQRRTIDADVDKVEGSSNQQLGFAPIIEIAPIGSNTQSYAGRLEQSTVPAPTSSAWHSRVMSPANAADDYYSMFDSSFDQFYSTCKERSVPVCIDFPKYRHRTYTVCHYFL